MNNNISTNALSPWVKPVTSSFCKAEEPKILKRIWLKTPLERDTYLCAQKLKFSQGAEGEGLWRILVLEPVAFTPTSKPSRFQRKSLFMRTLGSETRTSLFSYEAMMDALWAYFDPALADPLRDHKDHFVQEMSRCAINLDRQDRKLCGLGVGTQGFAAAA